VRALGESTIRLPDDQLERLADLIAERVQPPEAAELVDAAELARRLGVSKDAVYASARSFGAIRVGTKDSKRPRVIFNVQRALEAHGRTNGNGAAPRPSRVRRPRAQRHAPLLPANDGTQ
jgi:hypothetical protein